MRKIVPAMPTSSAPRSEAPLVSVVVPVFEVEPYLERCLDSLLAQTYPNFEVVAVNDGSTVGDVAILDRYEAAHPHLRVLHQENLGVGPARNSGIGLASGEFLAFVDADDYVEPDFLETMVDLALETGAEVVICNFSWDLPVRIPYPLMPLPRVGHGHHAAKMSLHLLPLPPFAWTKLYRRDWFDRQQLDFPPIFYEDVATTIAFLSRAERVAATSRPLYHYCVRSTGITGNFGIRNVADYVAAAGLVRHFLLSEGLWPTWRRTYGRMLLFASLQLLTQIVVQPNSIRWRDRPKVTWSMLRGLAWLRQVRGPATENPFAVNPDDYPPRRRRRWLQRRLRG